MAADAMQAWLVTTNTDLSEGRGHEIPLMICELEATAIRLGKGKYVQGTDAPRRKITLHRIGGEWGEWQGPVHVVFPTAEDRVAQAHIDARQLALEKAKAAGLTDEEIAALR